MNDETRKELESYQDRGNTMAVSTERTYSDFQIMLSDLIGIFGGLPRFDAGVGRNSLNLRNDQNYDKATLREAISSMKMSHTILESHRNQFEYTIERLHVSTLSKSKDMKVTSSEQQQLKLILVEMQENIVRTQRV